MKEKGREKGELKVVSQEKSEVKEDGHMVTRKVRLRTG